VDGEYYCIEDVCTHDGGPLGDGNLFEHCIECPRHGALFDIRDGSVLSMPAVVPVPTFKVKVEGDDIFVESPDY
jgi:3-phenylpropionate/trans-cinnamate dioxygenase ferredoxin subunit